MHRRLAQSAAGRWVPKGGFWVPKLSLCVPLGCNARDQGPAYPWAWGDASPAALVPNLALPPTPGLAPHCSTELVNHLSLARAAVSTVGYPTHTAVCCYPAALPPWPGLQWPGTCACTHPAALGGRGHMQDRSIGRVEGGQGRVHASSTVAVHPAPDTGTPLRKTADDRLLNRGAPSSVSLCRSISASPLLRDHAYSTLQTPSRAPSSQRPLPSPSLARSQSTDAVPTLSIAQLPNRPIPHHPRPGVTHASRSLARSDTYKPVDCLALQANFPPRDREGSPIPVLPRRGHAALNMRKRETHPYVSQHNER